MESTQYADDGFPELPEGFVPVTQLGKGIVSSPSYTGEQRQRDLQELSKMVSYKTSAPIAKQYHDAPSV